MPGLPVQTLRKENEELQAQVFTNDRQVGCSKKKITKLLGEEIASDGDAEWPPTLQEANKGTKQRDLSGETVCGAPSIGAEAE